MICLGNRIPTLVLRASIIFSAVAGILLCVFLLPTFGVDLAESFPAFDFWRYPVLAGLYAAAICFFASLRHFWILLDGIDKSGTLSSKNLRAIRICAVLFGILYFISAMPVFCLGAELDDAPGVILAGAFLEVFPVGAAAVAAVLERISPNFW